MDGWYLMVKRTVDVCEVVDSTICGPENFLALADVGHLERYQLRLQ
jgi:hypothetical protein